jgi:signal transduction histidine kinase
LQDLGLILALEDLAKAAAERAGTSLELNLPKQIDASLPPAVEQGVYRIAQEALENIVRHAGAGAIAVSLEPGDHNLTLLVQDDGQGIEPDAWPASALDNPDRLGIQGMRERASLIGGHLKISSGEGRGTTLQLTVPI